jgi:leader peptidase (prepilin peptidase)/N-methyltransferase
VFLCCLFLMTLTDLEDMIIPDGCHIVSVLAWLAALPFLFTGWGDVLHSLLSAVIFGGGLLGISLIMDKVLGRDSLGGGDIKLFAVVGLYLGIIGTLFTLLAACVLGLLMNAIIKRRDEDRAFPFGPAIAASAALMLLYGEPLIRWYQGLLL